MNSLMIDTTTQEVTTDPVVSQIVRSRLVAITDQMRLALQSVSGSPTVTEASDFFTGLYLPDGSFATMGHQVTFEAPPVGALIRHLNESGRELKEGDRIIGNDPFVGALHQNDLQMCAPLFVDGELVAWAGVMAHETDIGGMDFASWSPNAKEIWQEGLRIPAVELVSEGEIRQDIMDMILNASRLPSELGLDIKAFIATLNVASERLIELCHRYGTETVQSAMRSMVNDSAAALRRRLVEIPDGTVRTRDFLEHDGHENRLYMVDLVLTKKGDRLTFDFSESSEQAQGFVNCSRAGLDGGVAGALIPTLGFGIPWNDGLLEPVEIVAPDGLVCTAVPPAPVGSATVETVWVVSNVVSAALNKLLAATPKYAHRAQAVSSGTMATFNLSGTNQYGEKFGLHLMDPLAGGFGAFGDHDGQDAAGPINTPCPSIADVEVNEQKNPLRYLYRRLARDTGGAGRHRGGLGAEIALTVSVPQAEALVMTHGAEVPNSHGIGGGFPAGTIHQALAVGILENEQLEETVESIHEQATEEHPAFINLGAKPGSFPLHETDVFAVRWQGGGGLGDPLDRNPDDVVLDVKYDLVSQDSAQETYGVVLQLDDRGEMVGWNVEETHSLRWVMRAERLGSDKTSVPAEIAQPSELSGPLKLAKGETWLPLSDRMYAIRDLEGSWRVETLDGAVLSRGSTEWRAGAHAFDIALPSRVAASLHEDLAITGWACPRTGALLAVDLHLKGTQPLNDLSLDLSPNSRATTIAISNSEKD